MSDQYLAEIRIFAGNFAPYGWAFCNGQLIPISQNTALFSLLGTNYGGDGRTTFALPNLQAAAPIGFGQGPGLSPYSLGQTEGAPTITLLSSEMPTHTHVPTCTTGPGTQSSPAGAIFSAPGAARGLKSYNKTVGNGAQLSPNSVSSAGQSMPHNNMAPYLGLNFIIALQGIFPPRS